MITKNITVLASTAAQYNVLFFLLYAVLSSAALKAQTCSSQTRICEKNKNK